MRSNRRSGVVTLRAISAQTRINLSALNHYANLELLRVVDRRGNTRLFSEAETMRRVKEIQRLRRKGYPLRIIRERLEGASAP